MTSSKTRAVSLVLLLSATAFLALPGAGAAVGDRLVVGGVSIAPGNPCNAQGPLGGLTVKEAGTAGVLYYAVGNATNISMASTFISSTSPPTCLGTIVPTGLSGSAGWQALGYDAWHPAVRLWAARADGSGAVNGLSASGALQTTFTLPGVRSLAVDEASPHHLFAVFGNATLAEVAVSSASPYAASIVRWAALPTSALQVAPWSGSLYVAANGPVVSQVRTDGSSLGFQVSLSDGTGVDAWHQSYNLPASFALMAYDDQTYASAGVGALWTGVTTGSITCVANCWFPVYQCDQYEGTTCLHQSCVSSCTPPGNSTYVSTQAPSLSAYELERTCAVAATQPCVCVTYPAPNVTAPTNGVILRGAPAVGAYSAPVLVQGSTTVVASAAPGAVVTLAGPDGSVAGTGSASMPFSGVGRARGWYAFNASTADAQGCPGGSTLLRVFVENPVLRTRAQALRVEGDVPIDIIVSTIAADPVDNLTGSLNATVVDRHVTGPVDVNVSALDARALHGPVPGNERRLQASATVRSTNASVVAHLAALCTALTQQPACATLPDVRLNDTTFATQATAGMLMVDATGDAAATAENKTVSDEAGSVNMASSVTPCPVGVAAATVPCESHVGPFNVYVGNLSRRVGPLYAEAHAAAIRVQVTAGPHRGEIVLAESYAGISLGGAALLNPPVDFVAAQADFGGSGDAPSAPASGLTLPDGVFAGHFGGSDRADAFQLAAQVGTKIRVTLAPADRVQASLTSTAPAFEVAPRLMRLTLLDPSGVARDTSYLGQTEAHPGVVELNADVAGSWGVLVERRDSRVEDAPYLVTVSRSAATLLAQDGNVADAPDGCAGAPTAAAAQTGALGAGDVNDTYAIPLATGQTLRAGLSLLDDPLAADLDLRVLTPSCALFAQSAGGKSPPKGVPESLSVVANVPGTWYVQVQRANGVASYVLATQS